PPDRGAERLPAPEIRHRGARRHPQRGPGQKRPYPHVAVRMMRARPLFTAVAALLAASAPPAAAQGLDLGALTGQMQGQTVGTIVQLFGLLTVLSLAPGILIMVTSFTRFIIVFSILRSGLGLGTTPANMILISLSLFMTFYVMGPSFDRAWNEGVQPLVANEIDEQQAFE